MKKLIALASLVAAIAVAAGCSSSSSSNGAGPTPTPTAGGFTIADGVYSYTATSAPTNTCWQPPKTTVTLPLTIGATLSVSGNTITVTTSANGIVQSFPVTRTGDDLAGTSDGDAPLSSQGIDCTLHIAGNLTGLVTANDAFNADIDVNISEAANPGAQCSLLIGTISPQFDALPCEIKLSGAALKP